MGKKGILSKSVNEVFISYACLLWVFVNLDSFFIWNRFENILRLIAAIGVFVATICISRHHLLKISRKTFIPLLFLLLYYLWHTMSMDDNIFKLIGRSLGFVPLFLIMSWPQSLFYNIYCRFRKIIIFFAIGSFVISILSFLGVIDFIPYYVLGPRSALHENLGIEYHVYGLFVTNYGTMEIFPRACGMLQEPGHFAIVLGFVYMTDRLLNSKISLWIVLCGIMTFSSAFVLIVFVTELFKISTKKQLLILFSSFLGVILLLGLVFLSLSKDLQDTITYLAYDRNLKDVLSAGSLNEALDERINSSGDAVVKKLNTTNIWTGLNMKDEDVVLSDYRGVIVKSGMIGLILLILACFFTTRGVPLRTKSSLLFFMALVLIHRSWMYGSSYIFFLSFLATSSIIHLSIDNSFKTKRLSHK